MIQNFLKSSHNSPFAAIFLSGEGSNAEKLLDSIAEMKQPLWIPSVLVTDRPETSRAREIASHYHLPLIEHDITAFYRKHGMPSASIATQEGMEIREQWTRELKDKLSFYPVDFIILAGFMTLCNITEDFVCLNVHPGDLTVRVNGIRIYAGLHLEPTEQAILRGDSFIRSSVIAATKVSSGGKGMDEGPVLGISGPVKLDLRGTSLDVLKSVFADRQGKKRAEYRDDPLAVLAQYNVERLKKEGDWTVFPRVVRDFAQGYFAEENGMLFYRNIPVSTVRYLPGMPPEPVIRHL